MKINPKIQEFAEGALAFCLPSILDQVANMLGSGTHIEPKALLTASIITLAAYIRTRPTKQV